MHTSSKRRLATLAAAVAVACLVAFHPAPTLAVEDGVDSTTDSHAPGPCDMHVAPETLIVDGDKTPVAPGTVICLDPGTRGNLKLFNLHGTAAAPIVVRNSDGATTITGQEFEAGILISSSTHLRITGTGIGSTCGAEFDSNEQACGLRLHGTKKGIRVLTSRGNVEGLEIDHVSIVITDPEAETRGIAIHPVIGQMIAGIRIHHNHVSGTGAEAIYVGSEPRDTAWADLGKVDKVEIGHNLVEDIAWDGIKLKVALSDSRIHNNVIRRVGLARYEKHRSGITVSMSVVDVHDNNVSHVPEGIKSGRAVDGSTNAFHNNVVSDVLIFGIQTTDDRAEIYSNTVVRSEQIGIQARGNQTRIFDNIVANAEKPIMARGDSYVGQNLVGTTEEIGFVDAERGDFRPVRGSPAIGAGRINRLELCPEAGMRSWRPIHFVVYTAQPDQGGVEGCRLNLGARLDRPTDTSQGRIDRTSSL